MRALISRYPDFYAGSAEFVDLQTALEPEVLELWRARDGLLDQLAVETATWGLQYWEKTLGLSVEQSKEIAYRRSRIRSKLRGAGVTTVALIESVAESFSNGEVELTEFPLQFRLEIKFVGSVGMPPNMEDLTAALREIMPAHLRWEYVIVYNTWGVTAQHTWAEPEQDLGSSEGSGVDMNQTANLGLNLPEESDWAEVATLNENWEKVDEAVAKKAELGADGKIPAEQLPEMNCDKAGSAAAVQANLNAHTGNKSNPHGVTAAQVGADPAGSAAAVQANLNSHTGNRGNPHGVTAAQVGAIPTTGGSVSGALNFANNVWNNVGDDVAFGDRNISGTLCIKGLNGAPGIRLYNQDESKSYQVYGEHNVTSGTGDIGAGSGLASGNIYLCYE